MKKWMICLVIVILVCAPIMLTTMIMEMQGRISLSTNGFGIDASENLYIGKEKYIEVIDKSGQTIRQIIPHTSRGYYCTVFNDELFVDTGDCLYIMDLNGNDIDVKKNADKTDLKRTDTFVSNGGDVYKLKNKLLRYYIIKNDKEIVYRMPILDFAMKMVLSVAILLFVIFGFRAIYLMKINKNNE